MKQQILMTQTAVRAAVAIAAVLAAAPGVAESPTASVSADAGSGFEANAADPAARLAAAMSGRFVSEPDGFGKRVADFRQVIPALGAGTWVYYQRNQGTVDPERCTIFSKRRQQRIGIGSEVRLTPRGLQEAERGFALDGTQIWGTPQGAFTVMDRVTSE